MVTVTTTIVELVTVVGDIGFVTTMTVMEAGDHHDRHPRPHPLLVSPSLSVTSSGSVRWPIIAISHEASPHEML